MSESRQKLDFLASKEKDQKSLCVGEVTASKEYIQGTVQALAGGKMPSTGQITEAIGTAKDAKAHRIGVELSATGQRVGDRVDRVLDSTKQLISEKNANNEIQRLIHHSKIASRNLETGGIDYSAEKLTGEQNLQRTYSNMVVLSKLLVTSSEFRGLIADIYNLLRDVLRDNDVPYAEHLPHSDTFTNKDGTIDSEQAKVSIRKAAADLKQDTYSRLGQDFHQEDQAKHVKKKESLQDVVEFAVMNAAKSAQDSIQEGNSNYDITTPEGKDSIKEAQEKAHSVVNQASHKLKDAVKDFRLAEEQQDLLADRFASILDELRNNPEARQAVDGMLEALSDLKSDTECLGNKAKENFNQEVDENKDLGEAAKNAKRTVENFAGNHSLDTLLQMLREFKEDTKKDDELKQLMHDNREFFNKASQDTQFVHSKEFSKATGERFHRTRNLLLNKYREPIKNLSIEAQSFVQDLKEDPATNRAIRDMQDLTRELFLDADGRPAVKFDLLRDFQKLIPVLSKRLEKLDIPRICEKDDSGEYILDNISLACNHIAPKSVHVRTDTQFDTDEEMLMSMVNIKLSGIQASAYEIAFYFKKKLAVLGNVEDSGLVDVVIGKEGMDLSLKLAPREISTGVAPSTDKHVFRVLEAKCRVNDISVKLRYTKHDFLYKVLNRIIQNNVKRQIEKAVGDGIRKFLEGVESVASNRSSLDSSIKSQPLDTRPDGWKSEAFSIQK
ncbi:hypothetical protein DSO57_1035158 [Entomophthora muscae]|uniref:Uncharacterized protein n=1 Tax=Entomophthora muscae TaxID=34485 RepID=A0ACC2SNR8_9FUNG|nr:hypothetical protein DSO57_1035158 [Entomophthora muscae]